MHRFPALRPRLCLFAGVLLLTFDFGFSPHPIEAATFIVNSAADADDGSCDETDCTLCEAVAAANANPNTDENTPDEIHFAIEGEGPHVIEWDGIAPSQLVPEITDPVIIDAFTQPGAIPNSATPGEAVNAVYQIILHSFGGSNRFHITGGGTTVRGFVMEGFRPAGVLIEGPGGNRIEGNFIGVGADGNVAMEGQTALRGEMGVHINGSSSNVIGGTDPEDRNVISGFITAQVLITEVSSTDNVVAGNFLGTDAAGLLSLSGNSSEIGVSIEDEASDNTIGGTEPGARNLIAGNDGPGIQLRAGSNTIQGNFVGLDRTGSTVLENGIGLAIGGDSAGNQIGGTEAGAGNVISGNFIGIELNSENNVIQGNLIGTDSTGTTGMDSSSGVFLDSDFNTIGGTEPGARNVISGNNFNVEIFSADGNVIKGNYIGVDITGQNDLQTSILSTGIDILSSTGNIIGGTEEGAGNLISGHDRLAIDLRRSNENLFAGNFIGTNAEGNEAIPNDGGIGLTQGDRNRVIDNLISGNEGAAIGIAGLQDDQFLDLAEGTVIQGNIIGTNAAGTEALPNGGGVGVFLANNTLIGGTEEGQGNLISGNENDGIAVSDNHSFVPDPEVTPIPVPATTTNTVILGNLIGTDSTGLNAIPNGEIGVNLENLLGGFTQVGSSQPGGRNVISGNLSTGVEARLGGGYLIEGNFVGVGADGDTPLGNGFHGINPWGALDAIIRDNVVSGNSDGGIIANRIGLAISGQPLEFFEPTGLLIENNVVGTNQAGDTAIPNTGTGIAVNGDNNRVIGNLVSGNGAEGVFSAGMFFTGINHTIQGNRIGTNAEGTAAVPNLAVGLRVEATDCIVGGAEASLGNLISGNAQTGLFVNGVNVTVQGNHIGTDLSGMQALPNVLGGFSIGAFTRDSLIGGQEPGHGNVISGNGLSGLFVFGGQNNVIQGNYVGVNAGEGALGNDESGIEVIGVDGAPDFTRVLIGGSTPGGANVIAHNVNHGVLINNTGSTPPTHVQIVGNRIFSNGMLGIDLGEDGVTENDPAPDADGGQNNLQNFPVLTSVSGSEGSTTIQGSLESAPNTQFQVEFFSNFECDPSGNGEGRLFLGSETVMTDGSGMAAIDATLAVSVQMGEFLTSTATRMEGDELVETSEFSDCLEVTETTGPTATPTLPGGPTPTPTMSVGGDVSDRIFDAARDWYEAPPDGIRPQELIGLLEGLR